jgi:hypothetical protein
VGQGQGGRGTGNIKPRYGSILSDLTALIIPVLDKVSTGIHGGEAAMNLSK